MTTKTRFTECPNCGSDSYRSVASESAHFVYDRICHECETRYTPPTPNWMAVVGIGSGLMILVIIVSFVVFAGPLLKVGELVKLVTVVVIPVTIAILAGMRHFWGREER